MPVDGMEKKATCPDCNKRIKLVYADGKWHWADHRNKRDELCMPDDGRNR